MSGEIKRWSARLHKTMENHPEGDFVTFADHSSIVAAKDEEIRLGRAKYANYRAEMGADLQDQANVIITKDEEIARLKQLVASLNCIQD